MSDRLRRFVFRNAHVRGEFVSLDRSWLEVVNRHELPVAVRERLGELTAAALLLAATLKFDGKLILQIHGDGPVALLVVECDAAGGFRATAKMRDAAPIDGEAGLANLVNRQGHGRFVVTLDPGRDRPGQQPYQGIVPFEGERVAQILEHYMERSEQVPTRLWLAANEQRAVGLLLQRLPDEGGLAGTAGAGASEEALDDDAWNRLTLLAQTLGPEEMLAHPAEQLLTRLFWQEQTGPIEGRHCQFRCSCNRDKVTAMLKMLGKQEIDEVLAERPSVEVHCEFCNQAYEFDAVDCAALFAEPATLPPSGNARH